MESSPRDTDTNALVDEIITLTGALKASEDRRKELLFICEVSKEMFTCLTTLQKMTQSFEGDEAEQLRALHEDADADAMAERMQLATALLELLLMAEGDNIPTGNISKEAATSGLVRKLHA